MCNCCCLCACSVYITQPWTSLQCYFIWSFVCRVLAFTVYLSLVTVYIPPVTYILPFTGACCHLVYNLPVTCILFLQLELPVPGYTLHTTCYIHKAVYMSSETEQIWRSMVPPTDWAQRSDWVHMRHNKHREAWTPPIPRLNSQIWLCTTVVRHNKHRGTWTPPIQRPNS